LLVRINANHSYTVLSEQKETVRLGEENFAATPCNPRPCAARASSAHASPRSPIARATQVLAVATSATREAENRAAFVRHLRRVAGVEVRVISGKKKPGSFTWASPAARTSAAGRRSLSTWAEAAPKSSSAISSSTGFSTRSNWARFALGNVLSRRRQFAVSPTRYARMQRYIRTRSVRTIERLREFTVEHAIAVRGRF